MEDIRKCWKVPYIVYYCSLLEQTLDLIDLRVDEFEEAIIDDSGNERNIIILHLLQKLLKPFINRTIDLTNFESSLVSVLKKYNEENVFLNKKEENHWNDLTILNKIDIIHLLCELRLQLSDIEAKFNNIDPNCLRIEPIGSDSFENKLWYFGDLRLYEEKCPPKIEKKTTPVTPNRKSSSKAAKNKRKKNNEEDEEHDLFNLKEEKIEWNCVCVTLEDWNEFTLKYKKSRKKQDQELYRILEENYLNEMPALFNKAERERQQRLMALAPKRTSQRLVIKRQTTILPNYSELAQIDTKESAESDPIVVDKLKKEELSKQREERLKMREVKKDISLNNTIDENSQLSSAVSELSGTNHQSHSNSDFNARNYLLMKKVTNKLLLSKYAWPFKSAVTEDDAPDYMTIVEHPIDLSIIQQKVNNKLYKSRFSFCEDLQLIVSNCCLYNGIDSFYGKIALKFEAYYKRTLQFAYPREISNSFEEKNRLLLKLSSATSTSAGVAAATNDEENDSFFDDENANVNVSNENVVNKENESENTENKDSHEPEYVTKRTSSGRLVKMKVSTDYDYESDQDENKNKKRKNKYYADDEFVANGGMRTNRRRKGDNSDLSETSFDGDASQFSKRKVSRGRKQKSNLNDSDDEDVDVSEDSSFSDRGSEDSDYSDEENEYKRAQKRRGRKPRQTIEELLNSDENTSSTNDGSMRTSKKLTFEQYVKILTGAPSNGTNTNINVPSNGLKSILTTSSTTSSSSTNVLSATAAANASKLIKNINIDKLKVPIINPVVTAVLEANKLKQSRDDSVKEPGTPTSNPALDDLDNDASPPNILNVDSLSKSIKIIGMPQHLQPNNANSIMNNANKKVIIVNGNVTQTPPGSTHASTITTSVLNPSNGGNLVKIVNLSQPSVNNSPASIKYLSQGTPTVKTTATASPVLTAISKTVVPNRQIIVINNQQNVNKPPQSPVQILTKINGNTPATPTQVIKITTNQNSQPNIQAITKLATTTLSTPPVILTTTMNSTLLP